MEEILGALGGRGRVLDLGGGSGSLPDDFAARRVILDIERPAVRPRSPFVQGDAAQLPFRDGVFAAVVANHSLEHIAQLDACLREIGCVTAAGASLFVSVPDSTAWSDRVYRWLGRGGGHVNPFSDARALAEKIERETGLPHYATRLLHTGWSILNARNHGGRRQRKLWLFGGGAEPVVRTISLLSRWSDALLGTRLSIYGWAFYFGPELPVEVKPQPNVCVRCGSGAPEAWITANQAVKRRLGLRGYDCPRCGARNWLTPDPA